ncbi:MAG TPA: histidine kinase [Kofleriaceae bacterium]|nr:histidine kinase [Kofleriaceae bacterium]
MSDAARDLLPLSRVLAGTVAGLLAPRRLFPITVVVVPLLSLQQTFSYDAMALPVGMLMCAAFLLVAPTLWRYFFPLHGARGPRWLGASVYGASGVLFMFGIGHGLPELIGMGSTLLTTFPGIVVSVALFWVGGWGLARDIDLEQHLLASQARAAALERFAEHAQLLALRSHFDPHFLFNTLNAIAEWCREDGRVAERAILALSSMLHTIMTAIRTTRWPLAKELELVDALFQMYLIRDPELFVYARDVEAGAAGGDVPPMILLPIAENAMKHGPGAGHRGGVALSVRADAATLVIDLVNPGAYRGPRDGGSGLPMVEQRLRLAYGDRASFAIGADGDDHHRTRATVRVPRTLEGRTP